MSEWIHKHGNLCQLSLNVQPIAGINTTHVAAKRYEGSGFTRAVFRGAQYKGANIAADLVAATVRALEKLHPLSIYMSTMSIRLDTLMELDL
jgi:hypothetical protein